jgi:uncharacterized membrane protein YGL010W
MIQLGPEWSALFAEYAEQHADPRNQACHAVGIPLIAASFPVGATIVGLPLAAGMFATGWAFQLLGHYFEGKPPALLEDKRMTLIGLLWWLKKAGVSVQITADKSAPTA